MSRLILERGFSVQSHDEAQGFVITNRKPYKKELKKHKKIKMHKQVVIKCFSQFMINCIFFQDLKAEDEEFKVFRHLVKTNRINHKENFDFKKWNDRMYLKIIPDIKRLCTGTETKSDVFKCHLHYKTNPFLRLSPFKVEIFHNDPVVAVVHDFVSEKESNWVKSHARGRMRAATYFQEKKSTLGEEDKETVRIDFSSDRTSKTRFVADSAGKTVKTISERISFATEWNLGNNTDVLTNLGPDYWASENMYSENFRVMNYAPGGWVSPHIDTGGDGISSFMLYLR